MSAPLGIVVTGASRGIGAALARHFASDGHRVVGTVRDPSTAPGLAAGGVATVALDVTSDASVATLAAAVGEHLDRVDLLVNNAGIKRVPDREWRASAGPMPALERDAVLDVLATNVAGPLLATQALLRFLRPGAIVVNVSSQLGSLTAGVDVDYAYNASKAALNMVTVTMARDLGPSGIVAVALNPGWIRTDMTAGDDAPLELASASREIADLVVRLGPGDSGRFVDRFGSPVPW